MELVTSAANPTVKRFRLLAERKHRRRQGAFVVEGLQPVGRAVAAGWPVEVLVVAPDLLSQPGAITMVDEQERAGTPVLRVGRELFGRLSDRDGPAGLAAIVAGRLGGPEQLPAAAAAPIVALHRIANPGNLGTILRTADAVGAAGVVLIGPSADPFAPAAVKASMGSLFAVPVVAMHDPDEFFAWAAAGGRRVLAATGSAEREHWGLADTVPLAVLFGSEGDGLPTEMVQRCDLHARIPMRGSVESLNLASAVSVLLYELARPVPPRQAGQDDTDER